MSDIVESVDNDFDKGKDDRIGSVVPSLWKLLERPLRIDRLSNGFDREPKVFMSKAMNTGARVIRINRPIVVL